jgi:hypothetical protein
MSDTPIVPAPVPAPTENPETLPPLPEKATGTLDVLVSQVTPLLGLISLVEHEDFVKVAQQRELQLKQQLSDLGTENAKLKEKVENNSLLIQQLQQRLAEASRLLGYVWDWYKSRNPRKVHSFDKAVIEEIARFN